MSSKVNELRIGVVLSYISKFIQIIIGLLYTPLMIRILGQSEYGLYNIAASIIAYLGVLNFGFGSAYMRFYSKFKASDDKSGVETLNGMFLIIFSILGLVAIIAGIVVALNVNLIFDKSLTPSELVLTKRLVLILVVNLGVSFPVVVFNTYLQANEKFIFQNIIMIVKQVSTPLVVLPLLISGYGSVGMVIGMVLVNILTEILIAYYCLKKLEMRFSFNNFDRNLMKEMTIFSSYIFLNMIVDQVNNNLDKTILGRYKGTISVAIYSVAVNLNIYYTQISSAISSVFIPRIHRIVAEKRDNIELTYLFTKVGRIQFLLLSLVSSGFIFFGKPFIGLWAGTDYYESYYVALFLMIPITIPLIQNLGIEIQRAKNIHQFRSLVYIFMAIGNLFVSIPLSIKYGAVGAAMGTAVSYIIGNGILMNWHYHFRIGLNIKYFWMEILKFTPALSIPIFYGVIINQIINLYILKNLIIYGFIYVIVFIVSMWLLGLNKFEKKLVKSPFK